MRRSSPLALLASSVLTACQYPQWQGCLDCTEAEGPSTTDEGVDLTAVHTVTGGVDTGAASSGDGGDGGTFGSTWGEPAEVLPEVLDIDLPAEVNAAGPVPITVLARNTATMRLRLDGVDIGELAGAGKDVFVGELVMKGAIDNGTRHLEVIATLDEHEDREDVDFEVDAPAAGKPAWSKPGPLGSRANGVALTPEGDVIEAGLRIGAELPRPSIQKRSGFDGGDLWGKKMLVSALEGHVADVAIAPDGGIWVAMNVKEVGQKWRPHIVLLTPEGFPTGVDEPGIVGHTLRSIAADDDGGAFAAGYAPAEGGDFDIVYQGVSAAHQGTVLDTWDYHAGLMAHEFADAAMDVLIDGDVAWVAGFSTGMHDGFGVSTRGVVVPLDVHTGEVVGPVIAASAVEPWNHSMFFGVALDSDGVVVTGAGCQKECGGMQRIETSRYTFEGVRTWHEAEEAADAAYGSAVAVDSQGRAIVAGAHKEGGVFRGQVFARTIGGVDLDPVWSHLFPLSKESSEALAVATDMYDRVFVDGYITTVGVSQTWLVLLSP